MQIQLYFSSEFGPSPVPELVVVEVLGGELPDRGVHAVLHLQQACMYSAPIRSPYESNSIRDGDL